jgi:hypothetical protein
MRIAKSPSSGQGGILAKNHPYPLEDIVVTAPCCYPVDVLGDSLGPFKQRRGPPRLADPAVSKVLFWHDRIGNYMLSVASLNVVDKIARDGPQNIEQISARLIRVRSQCRDDDGRRAFIQAAREIDVPVPLEGLDGELK